MIKTFWVFLLFVALSLTMEVAVMANGYKGETDTILYVSALTSFVITAILGFVLFRNRRG